MGSIATTTIPTSTSAIVLRQFNEPVKLETVSLSSLRADEALVEVHATGICHSDLHGFDGTFPVLLPHVLGHEGIFHIFYPPQGWDTD